MKYITFAIPCYNSQDYMERAIESVLVGGDDVEIIIVNDGSKDRTEEIAKEYEEKYPNIVKAISQENGGHGEAVNTGLSHASGKYFKVVDSDDWLDEEALKKVLETLKDFEEKDQDLDMLISNYVYEKVGVEHKKVIHYRNALPQNEIFGWSDIGRFRIDQYILMHSVIYRTELLKLIQLKLPKHTFYVDNIYVYYPLPAVNTIYYLDVNLYRYYIGRDDQSVNEKNMIKRIDQQLFVRSKKEENLKKKKELWQYLKKRDYRTYFKIRYGILGQTMNLPGKPGRKISSMGYSVMRRIIGFN